MSDSIIGSWYAANPGGGTDQIVFTFLADGTFLIADKGDHARDPTGTSGLEWGTYIWSGGSTLSLAFNINTDLEWGLSGAGITDATVSADTLTLYGSNGPMLVDRLLSAPNSVVGSWYAPAPGGGTDQIVFSFLADGTYLIADKGTPARDPTGTSGIEWGTYTWDSASGAFTFNTLVNTDGQWGLSHSNGDITKLLVSGDTLTLGNGTSGMTAARLSPLASSFIGTAGNDTLTGTLSNDIFSGLAGNDNMTGMGGNDIIDGGAGVDTASYLGNRVSYTITKGATSLIVKSLASGSEGTDTLVNVERVHFASGGVAYDLDGNAGIVARILGAVFGSSYLAVREYVGIGLTYADAGMSYQDLMQLAINVRLGAQAGNHTTVVNLLYTNVTHATAPAGDLAAYVSLLDTGTYTVAGLGMIAANNIINDNNIGLTGLAQNGLEYV